jgi:hypothetical protein
MACWLIVLAGRDVEVFRHYARQGVYGTVLGGTGAPGSWLVLRPELLYTLADYVTMRSGDMIFFFVDRNIYGIGELVAVRSDEVAFCNWRAADDFKRPVPDLSQFLWTDLSPNVVHRLGSVRWLCTFRPQPAFFARGLDMDYALATDRGNVLNHLRVLSGRTFFRLEDSECELLARMLHRLNENVTPPIGLGADWDSSRLEALKRVLTDDHLFDPRRTVHTATDGNALKEAAAQVWVAHGLARRKLDSVFDPWSYVANLEPASPLKPREYMDEIDLFGYSTFETAGPHAVRYVQRYHLVELKGKPGETLIDAVRQAMKYVDWIAHERAAGDYSEIHASVLTSRHGESLDPHALDEIRKIRLRNYVEPARPYAARDWQKLRLVTFEMKPIDRERTDLALNVALAPA